MKPKLEQVLRKNPSDLRLHWPRTARRALVLPLAVAGFAVAGLIASAVAKTFAVQVANNATVTDQSHVTKHENIAVNSRGAAVYLLTGDSKRHAKCTKTNGCFGIWKPIKVASKKKLSKAPGVRGKLGVWRRNGFLQVTLAGHPLYKFVFDHQKRNATGEGIRSFGGTWHVIKTGGGTGSTTPGSGTTSGGGGTTTTPTTSPCLYPPCY